jgi:hypothetical protein
MSAGGPTRAEIPPDTRPSALLLGGSRRGAVLVFLPVALAGQALAWTAYAITGAYRPFSWFKVGLAYTLASVRVPFLATVDAPGAEGPPAAEPFVVAIGALTVAVVVLAFRAGRDQAEGLETRPLAAALAGASVGIGFAVPAFLVAFPVRLSFPNLGVDVLRPEPWVALLVPLAVVGGLGALGGVAATHEQLEATSWGRRVVAAGRGGFTALWWGLALAFIGFLLLAAVEMGATRAYGRFVGDAGAAGAVTVVYHALLLPNQSAMVLSAAMGSPVELVGGGNGATIAMTGVDRVGDGTLLLLVVGDGSGRADFPAWYLAFALVPLVATIMGGRRAGEGARSPRERALVGALAGVVYALGATLTAWAATLVVPVLTALFGGSTRLGPNLGRTLALALVWGIVGCTAGALAAPRTPR